jgi:hypothetical protein
MRDDFLVGDMGAELDVDGHRAELCAPSLFAEHGERARVVGPPGEQLVDRRREEVGAVEVEEPERLRGEAPDIAPRFHPALEELVDGRRRGSQPLLSLPLLRPALLVQELGAVLLDLDPLASPPAAQMAGYFLGAVEHAHLAVVGAQRQRLFRRGGRHRVDVPVEVQEGGLVDHRRRDQVDGGRSFRQREQARAFLGEAIADGAPGQGRVGTRMGDIAKEGEQLAVPLLQRMDAAAGEEAVA